MLKLGAPLFFVHVLALVMLMVANNTMAKFDGTAALAAIGIINTTSQLLAFPLMGITQGAAALWGYNYGAGKIDRVKRLTVIVVAWTTALGLLATAAAVLFPRVFITAFNGSDPALVEIGSRGLSVFMLGFFTLGIQSTTANLFISIGQAGRGGILYILRQVLFIVAMAVLPGVIGIEGVYWAGPITDLACAAIAAIVLAFGLHRLSPAVPSEKDRVESAEEMEPGARRTAIA
jgi:Na+-driven multidrug efflux pump